MKQRFISAAALIFFSLTLPGGAKADSSSSSTTTTSTTTSTQSKTSASAKIAYDDMAKIFGFTPEFFKKYPEVAIGGAWSEYKSEFLNPETVLPGPIKEMIGLAVAAQIPCSYCTYAHEKFAMMNGATKEQTKEAIGIASLARQWSVWFNGLNLDMGKFKKDTDRIASAMKQNAERTKKSQAIQVNPSWESEAKTMLGFVPDFLKALPPESRQGAWQDIKDLAFSPTSIEGKYKFLMSLAVSAQIPCQYCVIADTKDAKVAGATEAEIHEALHIASMTRKWSTILNGSRMEQSAFESEIDRIVEHAGSQKPPKQMGGAAAPKTYEDTDGENAGQ